MHCPNSERLFEWISIASEMRLTARVRLWIHTRLCADCRLRLFHLKESWQSLLCPEPDVTASIIRVYSRLRRDETLILKGWKLGESSKKQTQWLFRGAVGLCALVIAFVLALPNSVEETTPKQNDSPLAQIRYENKNRIQVRYVRPELLQSIEFETSSHP